jgi:hypothetical protein
MFNAFLTLFISKHEGGVQASVDTPLVGLVEFRVMVVVRAMDVPSAQHRAVDNVLRAFNTWAFKREQPSDPDLMREHVATAVARRVPVPFVLYWGKGPRRAVASPDIQCLNYLASMTERISKVYGPGASVTLVCTDTHALHNGHSPQAIQDYYAGIVSAAAARGFASCRLGSLSPMNALVAMGAVVEDIPSDTLRSLIQAAERWYQGDDTPEQGARRYYMMNMLEKRAIEVAYPDAIFITFNGSAYRQLFPDAMPIFYMYSIKRGVAVKPWFMGVADPVPALAATPACGDAHQFRALAPLSPSL